MLNTPFFIIIGSLIFSAFFSGIEIAYISVNKLKMEVDKNKGELSSKFYSYLIKKPAKFITTMLLGNNIALVIYGLAMGEVLSPLVSTFITNDILILFVQTVISTIIILIIAEFLPKVIFSQNPNRSLKIFTLPVLLAYLILYPFVWFVNILTSFIFNHIFHISISETKLNYGLIDLDYFLKDISAGNLDSEELDNEIQLLQNVLEFNSVKARECMIPRNEIIAIDINDTIQELKSKLLSSGHSKLPVYRGTIDQIIGFIYSSDLFDQPEQVKHILRPIAVVPETMSADEVMSNFIKKKKNMAVVVDEFGGTAGILTLEDVVEEIFGEIEDEHDKDESIEKEISPTEFIFSSRLEIDYLNEEYEFNLPKSENYETLAGLIIDTHESIPDQNEVIQIESFKFTILSVSENKINLIRLQILSDN